jgi:hypothetical protein
MSNDDPRIIMARAVEARERAVTSEQAQHPREVDERNERIQTVGVKAPASGTFGRIKKD